MSRTRSACCALVFADTAESTRNAAQINGFERRLMSALVRSLTNEDECLAHVVRLPALGQDFWLISIFRRRRRRRLPD